MRIEPGNSTSVTSAELTPATLFPCPRFQRVSDSRHVCKILDADCLQIHKSCPLNSPWGSLIETRVKRSLPTEKPVSRSNLVVAVLPRIRNHCSNTLVKFVCLIARDELLCQC